MNTLKATSIATINLLPDPEKREIYTRFIPEQLLTSFDIRPDFTDSTGRSLLKMKCRPGTTDVILDLRHHYYAVDPLLYVHLTDTMNGQIHVLLYILNDPNSERFDVDRMPDGSKTEFGLFRRNIDAEIAAYHAGLAPGQVHRGLRMLGKSIPAFESFVLCLQHEIYFVEPLYYHNAIVFERYGFAYQRGLNRMNEINSGFMPNGDLIQQLDGTSPFRSLDACNSIRGRSWAIHDGVLGSPFTDVTMYKEVGKSAGINTYPDGTW